MRKREWIGDVWEQLERKKRMVDEVIRIQHKTRAGEGVKGNCML